MTLVLNPVNADDAPSLMYPVKVVETSDPWYFMMLSVKVMGPGRLLVDFFTPAPVAASRAMDKMRLSCGNRVVLNDVVSPDLTFLNWIIQQLNDGLHCMMPLTESPGETAIGVE